MLWNPKLALIAASMISLAACAPVPMETAAAQPMETVVVNMERIAFNPTAVTINRGQTVEWRNPSTVPHTVTADKSMAANPANVELPAGAQPFHSGSVAPGASWSHTFTVPGTYKYLCLPHERAGMIATVVVR